MSPNDARGWWIGPDAAFKVNVVALHNGVRVEITAQFQFYTR